MNQLLACELFNLDKLSVALSSDIYSTNVPAPVGSAIVLGLLCEIASFVYWCIVLSTHEISISDQKINTRPQRRPVLP